jgi:hypothetical protein
MTSPFTIAVIDWLDASLEDGPLALRDLDPLIRLQTTGWLVREDADSVSVAMEYGPDERYRCVQHIPRVNIKSMRTMRVSAAGARAK